MSLLSRLVGSTINKVLSPSATDADINELFNAMQNQRNINMARDAADVAMERATTDAERRLISRQLNNYVWSTHWNQAAGKVKRHWR